MRAKAIVLLCVISASMLLVGPAGALDDEPTDVAAVAPTPVPTTTPTPGDVPDLTPYRGLGAWVDMYNEGPWDDPARIVGRMKARGATTLFLETANWGLKRDMFRVRAIDRFIEAAHANDIDVVAWTVPSFVRLEHDYRRARVAIEYETPNGERFDSFALDIEATEVRRIGARNRRLLALSERLRALVGPDYALGAIIPDPAGQRYWPEFPYAGVDRFYDVFLPMGYWTYRTRGYNNVLNYSTANIRIIRRETGDPKVPVNVIGGIADDSFGKENRAFVRALRTNDAIGGGMYDLPLMYRKQWEDLAPLSTTDPEGNRRSPKEGTQERSSPRQEAVAEVPADRTGRSGTSRRERLQGRLFDLLKKAHAVREKLNPPGPAGDPGR